MSKQHNDPRPGMIFVDRYMPGASQQEREEAYANVERLMAVLIQIDERLTREDRERDSREQASCGRVEE